jgi:2-polyprenyl-3-methyl-5-hydroxy-6-metoxy-1,4-benzoquinol methylase
LDYDPIKDHFGDIVAKNAWLARPFFFLLHIFFLRSWYVRRELKRQIGALKSHGTTSNAGQGAGDGQLRMLDAGTGFGQFADYVVRHFDDVEIDAVDIKKEYLDRAEIMFRRNGFADRVSFSVEDLTELKKEGPYDLILSVDVMEHILEDEAVFRHFHRVLRPGGVVIINTPSDQGGSDVQAGGDESFIGEHVRDGYNPIEIADKLRGAGLEPSHILQTYGTSGSLAWRFLIKWPMQLLNFSWLFVVVLPIYYLIVLIPGMILHAMDMRRPNDTGTGLLVVAEKNHNFDYDSKAVF